MAKDDNSLYSFKCGIASFVATYISGVMHPLDLIKTRFQSNHHVSQVMMASPMLKTQSLSTKVSSRVSRISTNRKASKDSTRASTSLSSVRLQQQVFSSGCNQKLIQLRKTKKVLLNQRHLGYEGCDLRQHRGKRCSHFNNPTHLGSQNQDAPQHTAKYR